jgi:hypothetical protein
MTCCWAAALLLAILAGAPAGQTAPQPVVSREAPPPAGRPAPRAVDECSRGPLAQPIAGMHDLDQDSAQWGVYCEGAPTWALENVDTPAHDSAALRCAITGGSGYSNIHCYRDMPAAPSADIFTLRLWFWISPTTTCNNQGTNSVAQALEFSISKWQQFRRYEIALQWQNVGDGAPQWRYWDPHRPAADRWAPIMPKVSHCLAGERWHTLTLEGRIVAGRVLYRRFTIDDQTIDIGVSTSPVDAPSEPDRLALAIQLDGNINQDAYAVFVDQVSFVYGPSRRVYLPIAHRVDS